MSIAKMRRQLGEGTLKICCVQDKQDKPITNQDEILGRIEEFYSNLYASTNITQLPKPEVNNEHVSEV